MNHPIATVLVLALVIGFAYITWLCLRPKKPNTGTCYCGKNVTMIAGHCPCGGAGFEKSRERSFN